MIASSIRVNLMYWYYGKVMYSTGIVVTSPQDHWRIKVRQMVELERDYGYLGQEKILEPMKRQRTEKDPSCTRFWENKTFCFGEEVMVREIWWEERDRWLSRHEVVHADGRGGGKIYGRDGRWK